MINLKNTKKSGYVLLLSILFLATISLAVGIFILTTGLSNSQNSFLIENSNKALSLAEACVESALQEIHDSTPFSGTATINFGDNQCDYEVINEGGQNRMINASGSVGSVTQKIVVIIDSINPSINITSWQEVADF